MALEIGVSRLLCVTSLLPKISSFSFPGCYAGDPHLPATGCPPRILVIARKKPV